VWQVWHWQSTDRIMVKLIPRAETCKQIGLYIITYNEVTLRIDQYDIRKVNVTGSETVGNTLSLMQLHSAQDEINQTAASLLNYRSHSRTNTTEG